MKHTLVAYLLWLAGGCGLLGLHRFYLGRWVSGLIWLFTGGLFLVGAIIDLFLIPSMVQVENLAGQLMQEAARNRRWEADLAAGGSKNGGTGVGGTGVSPVQS